MALIEAFTISAILFTLYEMTSAKTKFAEALRYETVSRRGLVLGCSFHLACLHTPH